MMRSLSGLALSLACSGCLVVTGDPNPNPNPNPNPQPVVPGTGAARPACAQVPYSFVLAGAGVVDATKDGYIITANAGTYRITWSGFREFRGSLFTTPGALVDIFPGCMDNACSLNAAEDKVVRSGTDPDRLDFVSFPASGKRSGFDIKVSGGVVYMDLLTDGQRRGDAVWFTNPENRQLSSASQVPIGLISNAAGSFRRPGAVMDFAIDRSAMPPQMDDNTFGIATSDGVQWILDWQPALDGCPHEFRGSVFTQGGFTQVLKSDNFLGIVGLPTAQQIDFVALGVMGQALPFVRFRNDARSTVFDLWVDGKEAIGDVLFHSAGRPATTDRMPFALTP